MNRSALASSTLVHLVAIWALFFFVPPGRFKTPPRAIQVALVNLPPGAFRPAVGEPVDAPAPKDEVPDVKANDTPQAPEKNAIRPPDAKPTLPVRPKPGLPSGVKTPTAALGVPGLSGDVAVDASDFKFTYYLIQVRNIIGKNWGAPAGLVTQGNRVRCTVYFKIDSRGGISGVKLEEPSGVGFFDQSAVRAVSISNPLPPLPQGYGGASLGVHFGFEYTER